ncbi:hypothetical protein SH449x_003649 [Pirellulaceae bacterium SH449]
MKGYPLRYLLVLAVFLVHWDCSSRRAVAQVLEGEAFKEQMSELLDICLENAISYQNYEVRIDQTISFLDSKDETKDKYVVVAAPIEERTRYALWIDWQSERFVMLRRFVIENIEDERIENEELLLDHFDGGQGIRRNAKFLHLPKQQTIDFRGFIKQVELPKIEMAPLCQFPASFVDIPFDKSINKAKSSLMGSIRRLPDGTWVRLVGDPAKSSTVTHFHTKHMLPVYLASGSISTPSDLQTTEYEEVNGIFRPTRMIVQVSRLISGPERGKSEKSRFMVGRGEIVFRWNQFNVAQLEFPKNEEISKGKVEWLKLLESE